MLLLVVFLHSVGNQSQDGASVGITEQRLNESGSLISVFGYLDEQTLQFTLDS